ISSSHRQTIGYLLSCHLLSSSFLTLTYCLSHFLLFLLFFFTDTATTDIYTLSLHDALPISSPSACCRFSVVRLMSICRPACTGPFKADITPAEWREAVRCMPRAA